MMDKRVSMTAPSPVQAGEPLTPIRQILCATDFSPASEPAWDEAQVLARALGAELLLLHVVPPVLVPMEGYFPPRMYQELVEGAEREAKARLDTMLAKLGDPAIKARSRVVEGSAALKILDVAREEGCDLLVVGTHGRTGMGRVLLGSVADRIVRGAGRPVVTVRPRPAGAPPARLGRILYATDFSPTSRAAWPWVLALAEATGAAVDLLHVTTQPVPDRHLAADLIGRMAALLDEHGQSEAERFLQQFERDHPGRLPRERVQVLITRGVAEEQIVHWAQARGADLIVIGTHGWSGLLRWMLGSAAHHLLQAAPCPVLTVGPECRGEEPSHAR
jgi:nucleotide-binding universal stress UspA family protein